MRLLDVLGRTSAHVVGMSMGGMITPPTEREAAIAYGVRVSRAIGSPVYFDANARRAVATETRVAA